MGEVDNALGRIILRGDLGTQLLAIEAELVLHDGQLVDGLFGQHHAVEAIGSGDAELVLAILIHGGGGCLYLFIALGHVHAAQEVLRPHHLFEQNAADRCGHQQVVTAAPAQGGVVAEVGRNLGLDGFLDAFGGLDGDLVTIDRSGIHSVGKLRVGGGVGQREGIHALRDFVSREANCLRHGHDPFAEIGHGAATGQVLRPIHQMGAHAGLIVEGIHRLFGVFIGFDAGGEVERGRLIGAIGIQHVQIQPQRFGQRLAGEFKFGIGQHVGGGVESLVFNLDGCVCDATHQSTGNGLYQNGFSHVPFHHWFYY